MPVYNAEKYIREAIDSLLAQTYTEFELIISDNYSTDGTEAICRKYLSLDPRVRYIRQHQNQGAPANFDFVLNHAVGEYFMWAASDDVWDVRWISALLSAIKDTNSQAAFGKIQCIDENSELFDHYANDSTFNYRGPPLLRQIKYFMEFEGAGKANPIYGLWRTEALRSIKLESYRFDYLVVFDLLKHSNITGSLDAIIYKRFHLQSEGGTSNGTHNLETHNSVRHLLTRITNPFPELLINNYYISAGAAKPYFVLMTPFKYVIAYWFYVARKFNLSLRPQKRHRQ